MQPISAKRIETPAYGRQFTIEVDPDGGQESQDAFATHLDSVLVEVDRRLEVEFNDPDRFFLDEQAGFPLRANITGEYYVSVMTYVEDDETYDLSILLHCLGCDSLPSDGENEDFDYVGMEMGVYIDKVSGELSYESAFQTSAI